MAVCRAGASASVGTWLHTLGPGEPSILAWEIAAGGMPLYQYIAKIAGKPTDRFRALEKEGNPALQSVALLTSGYARSPKCSRWKWWFTILQTLLFVFEMFTQDVTCIISWAPKSSRSGPVQALDKEWIQLLLKMAIFSGFSMIFPWKMVDLSIVFCRFPKKKGWWLSILSSSAEPHGLKLELNMGEALRSRDGGIGQWQKALRMLWEAKQRRSWSKVAVIFWIPLPNLSWLPNSSVWFLCPILQTCHRFLGFILLRGEEKPFELLTV